MITFHIEPDGKQFHSYCPELKGCHSFGKNPAEAIKNLKNAIELYLEDEMEHQTFHDLIARKKRHAKV
ncbi:type II toxin-antitoxin system HicB family antitoxin [Candidatus Peregrinibacteria bacterium]|nr:type II toxin-antitoxin system HicB family antitoxin [Candidatus Peregrinibacteria bacterium]